MSREGKIFLVGLGPGDQALLTRQAEAALKQAEVVVGYRRYVELVRPLLQDKDIRIGRMREEVERARWAVEEALSGRKVALISGGDPGLYGMVAPVLEVLEAQGWRPGEPPQVEIIPGITAALAASACFGAPLSTDTALISLSDQLEPWEAIAQRIKAAAQADFVLALYNPKSRRRIRPFEEAVAILQEILPPETPVGIAKEVFREGQRLLLTNLAHLLDYKDEIDMGTTIIVGRRDTRVLGTWLLTPRGYGRKYTLA